MIVKRADYVEEYGLGINRIETLLKNKNLSIPYYESIRLFFTIGFKRESYKSGGLNEPINEPINEPLNKRQIKILKCIKSSLGIKREDISNKVDVSLATIKREIETLVRLNLIERRGSKKTGGYFKK